MYAIPDLNIEDIKNIVETCFYLATSLFAYKGLNAWKAQMKGANEYQLAKNIITGAYRMRDAIYSAQSAFMSSSEWSDREVKQSETVQQTDASNAHFAYKKRIQKVFDERSALYPSIIEAEAVFGDDARKLFDDANKSVARLYAAIEAHFRAMYHNALTQDINTTRRENILYGSNPKTATPDPSMPELTDDGGFRDELDSSIVEIKKYFIKFIQ